MTARLDRIAAALIVVLVIAWLGVFAWSAMQDDGIDARMVYDGELEDIYEIQDGDLSVMVMVTNDGASAVVTGGEMA